MIRGIHSVMFWMIVVFLGFTFLMLCMGQTMAVFSYDRAVQLGLQESIDEITEFGVEVNRALGAGDTVVYLPLIVASLIGLIRKKHWAIAVTGAVMGISIYWPVSSFFMLLFLPGVSGYSLQPGVEHWTILSMYTFFGLSGLIYLCIDGDKMIE